MIRDPDNIIVYADIYSWQGMSFGAIHYYSELRCGRETKKVEWPLTQKHATYLNKENRRRGFSGTWYQRGTEYDGFLEYEDAMKATLARYKEYFPQARCLLLGKSSTVKPFPVAELDGSNEIKNKLNEIAKQAEPLSCEDTEPLTDEWEQLLAKVLGLEWVAWL